LCAKKIVLEAIFLAIVVFIHERLEEEIQEKIKNKPKMLRWCNSNATRDLLCQKPVF
jgi:hypothetical protein